MSGTPGHSGRRRKPSLIKKIEGNRRKLGRDRIREDVKAKGLPICPLHLAAAHRVKWASVIAALPAGVLSKADSALLESFVVSWQLMEESATAIIEVGRLVKGQNGPTLNPNFQILFRSQRELRSAGAELGLSPAARARLVPVPNFDDDPMKLLMGGFGDPADEWATN